LSLDAMIVDVMMPVMDGIELVRRLRARSDLPQVAALMLSASDTRAAEARAAGANAFALKPFSIEEIEATLDRIIEPRPQPI
ncbi:MAG: response regulator, partial [Candidatus Dormibacteria bacterium]